MATVRQDDFSAGMVDIDRAGVLPNAVFDATNVLIDGEAALRRRGSTRAYGSDGSGPTWVWHGMLAGGRRTVFMYGGVGFRVLADDSDGVPASPVASVDIGGSVSSVLSPAGEPPPHASIDGLLFIAPSNVYGGSRKSADWNAITVNYTNGSATVTRAAGGFTANVDAGMILRNPVGRCYVVKSVDSDTSLTLTQTFEEATAAISVNFQRVVTINDWIQRNNSEFIAVATVANRLCLTLPFSPTSRGGPNVIFSGGVNPDTGNLQTHSFQTGTDRHAMPAGAEIRALAGLRDRLFVFTTEGVYTISNMAYEIVDFSGNPQHRVELYTKDVKALNQPSIAAWRDALIVPAFDDIVLIDGVSAPVPITRGVRRAWREAVAAYAPGQPVVFANYLALPMTLAGTGYVWLFKLDAPVPDDDGPIFPLVRWTGGALTGTTALALRPVQSSTLPGGSRVLAANANLTGIFDLLMCFLGEAAGVLSAPQKADHATIGGVDSYSSQIVTRDFALGDAREGLLRRVQAWYTLEGLATTGYGDDVGSVIPDGLLMGAGVGGARTVTSIVPSSGVGPASTGRAPFGWDVLLQAERARIIFILYNDCTDFALHGIQLTFRESQRAY